MKNGSLFDFLQGIFQYILLIFVWCIFDITPKHI